MTFGGLSNGHRYRIDLSLWNGSCKHKEWSHCIIGINYGLGSKLLDNRRA